MKTRSLCIITLLALAVGGTCPSDVNNDGTVGIQDFLQVLSDWGPCPSASVVASASFTIQSGRHIFRVWSSGLVEVRRSSIGPGNSCFHCDESTPPPDTWVDFGTVDSPGATAVHIHHDPGQGRIYVTFSDGAIFQNELSVTTNLPGCTSKFPLTEHCDLNFTPWEPLT